MITMYVRHFFEAVINPFFMFFLLLMGCTIWSFRREVSRPLRYGLVTTLTVFLLLSTGFVTRYLTSRLESQYSPISVVDPNVHWVVVLGGGHAHVQAPATSRLTIPSIRRLMEGVRLYRHLPNAKLVLSGGGYSPENTEANEMAALAALLDIPPQNMLLEERSINTADQAIEVKKIVGDEPFYLVTSAIHMPRAVSLCRKHRLNPIPAPTDLTFYWNDERWEKLFLPTAANLALFNIAWHELLGRAWSKMTA